MKQKMMHKEMRELLQEQTPLLSQEALLGFVDSFLARREEFLAPLTRQRTPLYLFEPEVLSERSCRFQEVFRAHFDAVRFYYAVKSNNYPEVSRVLIQTGFGLDVSSGLELSMALELGAEDIIFSGPGKTKEELEMAVQNSERLIVLVDSFNELATLGRIAASCQKMVRIGVRLTTNPQGLWRKFGILPEELMRFWKRTQEFPNLLFQGLQFHTSWNLSAEAQLSFIRTLSGVLSKLPAQFLGQIAFIDVGGGYWPEQGEWLQPAGTPTGIVRKALGVGSGRNRKHFCLPACSIELFARQLGEALKRQILPLVPSCCFCFEPGRWICNDAMHLLMSVVDKKGNDLIITDAGTNAVGWERFETDYFPVLNLSRPAAKENDCHILGALCTPHDVWGYNYWGEDIQIGDVLMIPTQGAYTYSLRQNFIKPVPEVFAIQALTGISASEREPVCEQQGNVQN